MHDHVVSPETARKLVDAGVDCPSMLVWVRSFAVPNCKWWLEIREDEGNHPGYEELPAWVATELMERMTGQGKLWAHLYYRGELWASQHSDPHELHEAKQGAEAIAALILEGHDDTT